MHTGERCSIPVSVHYEVEPASYVEDVSGQVPYYRCQWALEGWVRNLVGEVVRVIRPAQQQLAALLRNCTPWDRDMAQRAVAGHLSDQAILARTHEDLVVRGAAVEKLIDQDLLALIARTDPVWDVRWKATQKLTDQQVLAAIKVLIDRELLRSIAAVDPDGGVRGFAEVRLWKLEHGEQWRAPPAQ